MGSPKKNFVVDPDYEMSEIVRERVRLREERENKEKLEKVKDILNREFQTELNHRQSQLELIQQRLNQAQKTLHLLRYVLITSYYNENEKAANQLEEASTSTAESLISDKNRLHPAVKKLLEHNSLDLNLAKTPRKRFKHSYYSKSKNKVNSDQTTEKTSAEPTESERVEIQSTEVNETVRNNNSKEEFDTSRNRKKSKHHIRVGNISKWMPSESKEDKSTHKWMVYVRGSKESPDISHFVRKVVFYLHPSYQPNDVIEIREPPFHLSRRGWGEFRVRVRLFFRCPLNKPVDIYHDLKLDQTFSGRQQLANETAKDLFLYDDNNAEEATKTISQPPSLVEEEAVEPNEHVLKESDFPIKSEITIEENTIYDVSHFEHDYCYAAIKKDIKEESNTDFDLSSSSSTPTLPSYDFLTEHSYFQTNSSSTTSYEKDTQCNSDEHETDLMYGIKETEENKNELIVETVWDDLKTITNLKPQYSLQRLVMGNGTVIEIKKRKKPQQSLLKKMFQKKYAKEVANSNNSKGISILRNAYTNNESPLLKPVHEDTDNSKLIDYNKYKIDIPSHRFKNVSEVLPYLFKRLPLITNLALDVNYKCTYPYVAKSVEEYSNWNIGKRLSSEWFQAKTVQKLINSLDLLDSQNWTTKALIMYARSHGYTPLCSYSIFKNKPNVFEELSNGIVKNENGCKDYEPKSKIPKLIESDDVIDIENCTEPKMNSSIISNHKERLVDYKMGSACSYVKQAVLDVGIILKPEEIVPGVVYNAAERILLQASLCLAEDIIRRAQAYLVLQGNFREDTSTIGIEEIQKALQQRTEFCVVLRKDSDV